MYCCDDEPTVYGLIRDLFCALSVTCFLYAMHRVANGLMLTGQVAAYDEFSEAFAPEEREVLIHKVKHGALRY